MLSLVKKADLPLQGVGKLSSILLVFWLIYKKCSSVIVSNDLVGFFKFNIVIFKPIYSRNGKQGQFKAVSNKAEMFQQKVNSFFVDQSTHLCKKIHATLSLMNCDKANLHY